MYSISTKKAYFFGFSRWKHGFIQPFFSEYLKKNIFFINPLFSRHKKLALKKGLDKNSVIYIWGKKEFQEIEQFANEHNIEIYRVEDGFIRSVGLGSDLTQPYSLIVDSRGIYFDPTAVSSLEEILLNLQITPQLLERAQNLKELIKKNKISKYNTDKQAILSFATDKRVALVVGQVEDDASIYYGANGMTNKQLLQKVQEKYSDRYIVFKPHPDVLSGNRVGNIASKDALQYCNEVVSNVGMGSVLQAVDEVHTMSSLTGFEALLYEKDVYTYGVPFYAGWGLTTTEIDQSSKIVQALRRRDVKRTLDELIVATLILYPRYIDPITKKKCEVEELIEALKKQQKMLEDSFLLRIKFRFYAYLSRILQKLLSLV